MSIRSSETSKRDIVTRSGAVVVGVAPHGRSESAVVWAVDEAERHDSELVLVSATESGKSGTVGEHDGASLARRLTLRDVEQRAIDGDAVDVLLAAASEASMLVVGARAMRATQRLLVGSTSRAVASWSPVPVVIVPETWIQPSMGSMPVVVGVRPSRDPAAGQDSPDEEVLAFAFPHAGALRAPLIVVSAFEPPWLQTWSPDDLAQARAEHETDLDRRLAGWRETYSDVDVIATTVAAPAGTALCKASQAAQLTIVGRHHSRALTGHLGQTARHVLKEASRPVAVVPSGGAQELRHQLAAKRALAEPPWGPLY